MNIHRKQISALELAIDALTDKRRKFAPGEKAYTRQGLRPDKMQDEEFTYTGFVFVEQDHKSYTEYTQAIQELEDLIEILEDPGVTVDEQMELFEVQS